MEVARGNHSFKNCGSAGVRKCPRDLEEYLKEDGDLLEEEVPKFKELENEGCGNQKKRKR